MVVYVRRCYCVNHEGLDQSEDEEYIQRRLGACLNCNCIMKAPSVQNARPQVDNVTA